MTQPSAIARVSRVVAFVRYMPLRKVLARVDLDVRRRMRDRFPGATTTPVEAVSQRSTPPAPLFAGRNSLATFDRKGGGAAFTFLNRQIVMAGPQIDWSAPGPTSADQLWRMNLHYMEYLEGANDGEFCELIASWIAACPASAKRSWRDSWNSYALSLRVVVWMQQLAIRRERLPPKLVSDACASLAAQVQYLEANLETDLGGNHLIKNIKALLWASVFFTGPPSARWHKTGVDLLARELDRQVLPDGCHDERSASYHAQVFADLMECRHALGSDPLGGRLDAALAGMAQAVADLSHPDGGPALFNDAGLTMAYAPHACLAAYERLTGTKPQPRAVFAFRDAGYFGLRSASTYLIADCGRIAPDDLPAHGHADVLSFELSVAGERIIVDQGVFEYVAGDRRRQSRAAANHNTLSVDGADQADFFGAFRCGRRPNIEVRHYEQARESFVLEGSHDGYCHLPGRPRHVRRFEASPDQIAIHDRIEGSTDRAATINFLLHPDVEVTVSGRRAELVRGAARLVMTSSQPFEKKTDAVWWPDMGQQTPAIRLAVPLGRGISANLTTLVVERPAAEIEIQQP